MAVQPEVRLVERSHDHATGPETMSGSVGVALSVSPTRGCTLDSVLDSVTAPGSSTSSTVIVTETSSNLPDGSVAVTSS